MAKRSRKMAIILFADIVGFTSMSEVMDAEEVINILNVIWDDIDSLIVSNNGVIDKHNGDNVIATWGIKNTFREDPFLAAKVALDIINFNSRIETEPKINFRVGIHYGPLVSGEIGLRKEFTIIGDAVNTTARLESTAENGTIQISGNFAELIRSQYMLEEIGFVNLKGKDKPIKTYRLLKELKHKKEIKFVYFDNRVTELIDSIIQDNRKVKYHIIIGQQGTGKTELLREYSNIKRSEPESILLDVSAQHKTISLSLFVVEQLLKRITNLFNITENNIGGLSLRNSSELTIRKLLQFNVPDDAEISLEFYSIFSSVIEFFNIVINSYPNIRKIIFAIDEYNYIDESSKKFLTKLSEGFLDVDLEIITASQTPIDNELYLPKELKALDASSVKQLLYEVSNETDDDHIKKLLKQSNGNLLFILEMNRLYHNTENKELPESLNNLIQIQLESLSKTTLNLVKCASACGVIFPYAFIEEVLQNSNLKDNFQEAFDKSLIYFENQDANQWSFSNNAVYKLVYESLLLTERKDTHISYAKWLEKKEITSESIHFIAYNYYKGGEYNLAFKYYFEILERYCDLGLYFDAMKVVDIVNKFIHKFDINNRNLGEFYYYSALANSKIFNKEISNEIITKAYEFINYDEHPDLYKRIVILSGDDGSRSVNIEQINSACTRIRDVLKKESNSYLETLLYFYEGSIDYAKNDHDSFLQKQENGLALAKINGHELLISKFQNSLAGIYTLRNRYKDAEISYLESIEILERYNTNPTLLAKSLGGLAVIYGDTGNLQKYEEYIEKAYEMMKNSERGQMYTLIVLNLIEAKLKLNKYHEFKETLLTLLTEFKQGVNTRMITPTLSLVARYFFKIGNLEKAYMYIGYSYNCPPNFRPSIDYVNGTIFIDYPKYKIENLDELIDKWKTDNLELVLKDMIDNFNQLFTIENV